MTTMTRHARGRGEAFADAFANRVTAANANASPLREHFDELFGTPDAVDELDRVILQLAIRGKLTQPDATGECANKHIEYTNVYKTETDNKSLSTNGKDEDRFDLPVGWQWVRLESLCKLVNGDAYKPSDWSTTGARIIRIENLNNHSRPFNHWAGPLDNRVRIKSDDVLLAWSGTPGTSFGTHLWQRGEAVLNQHIFRVDFTTADILKTYFVLAVNARLNLLIEIAHGGAGLRHVKKGEVETLTIPLPPLPEQHRIVARVEQIFTQTCALREKLAHAQTELERVNKASLAHLLAAATPQEFAERWSFTAENFDTLYAEPEHIASLRQAILELAVRGKLTRREPEDEPASQLLERIRQERESKDPKGFQKPLGSIPDDEKPFELPEGWEWTTLPEIGQVNPRNNESDNTKEASFIPMAYIPEEYGAPFKFEVRPWGEIRKQFTHLQDNDVAVAKITPCFENGKAIVFRNLVNGIGAGTTELHVFRGNPEWIVPEYVLLFFKNAKFVQEGKRRMTGSAGQQRVPKEHVTQTSFPLPPTAEQHRIVARVEQLMKLCDALEAKLAAAQDERKRLTVALLAGIG